MATVTSDVKVLGSMSSPYVNRVEMALKIKSVQYEFVETNPFENGELLVKSNPVHKKIPVLIHGGKPISESLIIVEYIDDVWATAPSILPSNPYDRSVARFWAAYIDDKWFPLFRKLREVEGEEAKSEVKEKICEGLVLLEGAFLESSKGKGFFSGEENRIGYVDIALGCYLGWVRVSEMLTGAKFLDETKIPNLVGWADSIYSNNSVKDVVLDPNLLLQIFKNFEAAMASHPKKI